MKKGVTGNPVTPFLYIGNVIDARHIAPVLAATARYTPRLPTSGLSLYLYGPAYFAGAAACPAGVAGAACPVVVCSGCVAGAGAGAGFFCSQPENAINETASIPPVSTENSCFFILLLPPSKISGIIPFYDGLKLAKAAGGVNCFLHGPPPTSPQSNSPTPCLLSPL